MIPRKCFHLAYSLDSFSDFLITDNEMVEIAIDSKTRADILIENHLVWNI